MQTETDSPKSMLSGQTGHTAMDLELFNFGHPGTIYSYMQPDASFGRSDMTVIDCGSRTVDVVTEYRGFSASRCISIISRIMEMEKRGVRFLPKQVIKRALRKTLKGAGRSELTGSTFPHAKALHHEKNEVLR